MHHVGLAVVLGTAAVVALQFHAAEPAAGYLLLPFLGYTTFGALLLSFSLQSSSTEVCLISISWMPVQYITGMKLHPSPTLCSPRL